MGGISFLPSSILETIASHWHQLQPEGFGCSGEKEKCLYLPGSFLSLSNFSFHSACHALIYHSLNYQNSCLQEVPTSSLIRLHPHLTCESHHVTLQQFPITYRLQLNICHKHSTRSYLPSLPTSSAPSPGPEHWALCAPVLQTSLPSLGHGTRYPAALPWTCVSSLGLLPHLFSLVKHPSSVRIITVC